MTAGREGGKAKRKVITYGSVGSLFLTRTRDRLPRPGRLRYVLLGEEDNEYRRQGTMYGNRY